MGFKHASRFVWVLVLMLTLGVGQMWGATSTLTFTAACGGSGTADDKASWTITSNASESAYDSSKGIHYGTGSAAVSYIQLTTSSISGTISQVVVNASGASGTSGTVSVTVGSTSYICNNATSASISTSATTYTFSGSASGTITVRIEQSSAKRALYCKSIAVTYTATPATITLSKAGSESSVGGTHYVGDSYTLPKSVTETCGSRSFVGWSSVPITTPSASKPTASTYHEPEEQVALDASNIFYAVYAETGSGGSSNGSKTLVSKSSSTYYSTGYITGVLNTDATWTTDAFAMVQHKVSGNSAVSLSYDEIRVYANHSLTFSPSSGTTITSIVVTAGSDSYATALGGSSISNCTKSVSSSTVTITPTDGTSAITLTNSAQSRLNSIVVSYTTGGGSTYSNYTTQCCTELGSINGSINLSQETTGANAGKLTASWPAQGDKTGWADNGLIVKIYEDGNSTPVHTSSAISKDATSYTATGFTPGYCTTYYATLTPQKADNTHCDGVESTAHTSATTKGQYTYGVTLNGMQLKTGEVAEADNCSDFDAIYEPTGTNVLGLTAVSVTNAGAQGTGWTWNSSTGALHINKASVTGNVTITITGNKPEDPIVTPSTSSLNFGTDLKMGDDVPTYQTFTISGSNLTADLAVASSNSSLYAVSVSGSLTPTAGEVSATITVTPQAGITDAAGKKSANITISGGGLAENVVVVASMTVLQTYTITWSVNGQTSTTNVTDGSPLVLPTPAPTVDGCEDGKAFVGWTATAIVGSTDTKPGDLFTTAGGAPAISSDKTFYAVFASVSGGNYAEANTVLWSEDFSGFSAGDAPNTSYYSGTGRTIYNGGSVTYACQDGNSATKLYEINNPNNTGGETPEILINKKSSADVPGAFSISGIPTGGAATMTLTYRANGTGITISSGTSGISIGNRTGSNPYSHTITVTGEVTSFDLAFTNATNSNLRMDNYSVVVATAGSSSESGYITSCTKQVAVTATDGGTATINGEAAVNWTSFETDLALVATPSEGYVFAGWSYDKDIVTIDKDNAAEATANSLGAATITANFLPASTISADKDNLALVAYVDELDGETTVTFTSSDAPQYGTVQYSIEDWTETDDTYITITSPASKYTYLSTADLDQSVTVSYGSTEAGSFSAKLVATAYSTGNVAVGAKIIPITLTIKPKFTVTAVADDEDHATAVSASPNTDVKDGTTVTLSQTAADGWIFQKWTISYTLNAVAHNEDLVGNTFTMPAANVTATAVYTEKSGTDLTAPTNAAVDDESITSHSALLSWDAVDHASSYTVYVMGEDESVQTIPNITTNSYTVTDLKAETEYYWSVTAIGDGEEYYNSSAANGPDFTTTARVLSSIAIKTPATKMSYNEGETFVKTGLEVTATYDDKTTATISAANLVVTNEPLEVGTTSITVSYTENEVLKSTTLEGITVNELGSVTWSANGVTNVVKYAEGAAIVFPESASGCFGKSFVGWSESTIDGETDDAPTLVSSATMGATNKTYYAVFAIVENSNEEKSYGWEDSDDESDWTITDAIDATSGQGNGSSSYAGKINTNHTYVQFKNKVNVTEFSFAFKRTSTNSNYNVYIETSANGTDWSAAETVDMGDISNGSYTTVSHTFDGKTALYIRFHCSNTTAVRYVDDVHITYSATTGSKYATSCCTPNTITISDAIKNGSVSTGDVTSACEGTEITLSASAAEGYEFGAWTVMQGESDITETNVAGNVLTMPAGNVTVSASFNKIAVTDVTINGEENVQINNDVVWTLDITPAEARPTVVWSTANDAVATVSNGTVHGVAVGSTTITATVDDVPYNKTINVIAATVLDHISISDPQTAFTMGDAFVAPTTVTANYIYEVGGAPAPSVDVTASATVSGYNMNVSGEQTVTVSFETKSYQYNINVAPWTLHLQTKRMYGNDVETPTVVDATINTLEAPTALSGYYVAGLCEGYTQLGYITSSENIDALPNDLLTSYTPSANNETLYGVFQKTNYVGVDVLTEDFSDQKVYDVNFPSGGRSSATIDNGSFKLGSGNGGGSITSKTLSGLSHNFKVELKAKRYNNDKDATAEVCVTFGSTTKKSGTGLSTSTFNTYTFEFEGSELSNTITIATLNSSYNRIYVDEIHIYTLDDMEYMSVYDCREPKDVTYEIGNEQVVWTACENTTVMEGQNYTLCANEPSLQGYDFGGWIINGDEENVKAAGAIIEVATDLTITPKFTEHVYDYQYALATTATNGTIASVTVNGIAKALNEVALHDGDAVVVTAVPNTNYELSEWTKSENITSLTTDGNTASFTVAVGAGDMTIAAVFVEKAQYTMTLNVFGRTYTTKQGHEGDTYNSVLDNAQSPALTGYSFQGWSTDAENANAIISGEELLTANVTLYAIVGSLQPTGYVYHKVTSMGDITDDGYYLIVNETANKAFDGALISGINEANNYVSVSISENEIISNAAIDAAVVTIGTIQDNDSLYIKTASGYYLGAPATNNGFNANTSTVYKHKLSFSEGKFVVNSGVTQNNTEMVLRYNNSRNFFGFYKGTQEPIQLYKRGEVHSEIIPEAEPVIEISTEVSASTSFPGGYVGDVTVVNGGSLNADINLSVGDLIIHSTLGKGTGTSTSGNAPGSCGQIANGSNITVTGDAWIEIELTQESAASYGWYAFSVPFRVDAMHGVYGKPDGEDWQELQNEVGYAIMKYHGDVRAQGLYGWKKYRDIMEPGTLYIIAVGKTEYKTLRFKKVANANLVSSSTVTLNKYGSETSTDAGWNGIGNPNLQVSNYATGGGSPTGAYIQFLDHSANAFKNRQRNNVNLVVGSAFFFQYTGENEQTSITINTGAQAGEGNGYLAPKRERNAAEETIYEVELTNVATEEIEDNIFLTAREEALNEYEIGRDVAKMSMGNAKCAQMWVPAYGTQLCAADFQLINDKAEYPLIINTPKAGTYSINAQENENATIYLTRNGRAIWNLSMSACELDLAQGLNEGYGLRLVVNAPAVVTGIDEVTDDRLQVTGAQKVIIDEHVYILRGGQMYDVNGKLVK